MVVEFIHTIWPAAPVTATRTGFFCWGVAEPKWRAPTATGATDLDNVVPWWKLFNHIAFTSMYELSSTLILQYNTSEKNHTNERETGKHDVVEGGCEQQHQRADSARYASPVFAHRSRSTRTCDMSTYNFSRANCGSCWFQQNRRHHPFLPLLCKQARLSVKR